jgi:hypothetical protein
MPNAITTRRWGGRILVLVGIWFVVLGVADAFAGVFSV